MHVFQPFPTSELELDPYTILGESGIIVTVESEGKINAMASTSVGFGRLWSKNAVFIIVRESRYTKELLDKSDFFSVTFFEDKYKSSVKYVKSVSGRQEDKLETAGLHVNKKIDIPFIDEGNLVFLCNKLACIPVSEGAGGSAFINNHIKEKFYPDGDYHSCYIGEILEILAR